MLYSRDFAVIKLILDLGVCYKRRIFVSSLVMLIFFWFVVAFGIKQVFTPSEAGDVPPSDLQILKEMLQKKLAGVNEYLQKLRAQPDLWGAILVVAGLLLSWLGIQVFKPSLFLVGFSLFALIGIITVESFPDVFSVPWMQYCMIIGCGIIGGLLCIFFMKLAKIILGAVTGAVLGYFINRFIVSQGVDKTYLVIFVCSVIGIVLILLFSKAVVIICTAVHGSLIFVSGVDVFIEQEIVQDVIGKEHLQGEHFGLLTLLVINALLGIYIQYRLEKRNTRRREKTLHNKEIV